MSQQGEKPAAHEDDWWRALYDETAPDTGPSGAADSLDDRFDSASDAVGGPEAEPVDHPVTVVPLPDPRLPEADQAPGEGRATGVAPQTPTGVGPQSPEN
ncbi:hypothetical protein PV394_26045, partial [Streptomyces sp. NE06-03E]|nr:hypothetical protein [Streptomyces sp. NE06-03E]